MVRCAPNLGPQISYALYNPLKDGFAGANLRPLISAFRPPAFARLRLGRLTSDLRPLLLAALLFTAAPTFVSGQTFPTYSRSEAADEGEPVPRTKHRPASGPLIDPDGTWIFNTNNNPAPWSTTTNWSGGIVADGGGFANFSTIDITGGRNPDIDTTSRTVRRIDIGDTNNTHSYTISASGGASLIFDNTANSANAQLNEIITSHGDTISAPIVLNSSLDITNASAATLTLSAGGITAGTAGTKTITTSTGNILLSGIIGNGSGTVAILQNGPGTLTLNKANTFTGGFTIGGGTVNIGAPNALSTGTLTINGGTLQSDGAGNRNVGVTQINVGDDFTIGGANTGTLSFAAPIDLGGSTRQITDDNTTNITIFGGIISNGGLIKAGNGQLNLTGASANTYTGLTTVSAGTLGLGKSTGINAFGGDLTINGGSVLYIGTNDNQIPDSAKVTISSGSLAFGPRSETIGSSGTSGLALSGTGAITFASGTISVANSATMTGGTITMTSSGTFNFNTNFAFSGGTIDSTYAGASNAGFRLRGGDGTGISYAASGTSTAVISNTGNGAATLALNNAGSATTVFDIADSGSVAIEMTISMKITGGAGNALQKTGAGVLVLSGASTYTAGTAVSAGTLGIGADSTPTSGVVTSGPVGTGTLILNGGAIQAVDADHTIGNAITLSADSSVTGVQNLTLNGTLTQNGSNTLTNNIGTGKLLTLGGQINLSGNNTGHTLTITGAGNITFGGAIQDGGTGAGGLAFSSSYTGTATISGNNTYTGITTLSSGTINANSATAFGSSSSVVMNGITLDNTSGAPITLTNNNPMSWGGNNIFTGTNDLNLGTGAVTLTANRTWTINNGILTVGGAIGESNGSKSLKKDGVGTLVLSGQGTFTGGMTLIAGTLGIGADSTPTSGTVTSGPVGTGTLILSGGAIQAVGAGHTIANVITLSSDTSVTGVQNLTLNGAFTQTGNKTLTNNIGAGNLLTLGGQINLSDDTTPHTLTLAGTGDTAVSGVITNGVSATSGNVTITNTGLTTFSAANSYAGTTTLGASGGPDAGTVRLSGAGTLGATTNPLVVIGGTLDLNGTTQTIGALALGGGASGSTAIVAIGSGNLNLGGNVSYSATNNPNGATISGSGGGTLSLINTRTFNIADSTAAAADLTVSAIIQNGGGNRGITKTNTGTLLLSGNNTFTGATTINTNGGTIEAAANGALGSGTTGTSGITVNSGGTLVLSNSSATDRVKDTAGITLAGGTFKRSGTGAVSEGSGASVGAAPPSPHPGPNSPTPKPIESTNLIGLGALTLTANSTFDFGTDGVGTFVFTSFNPNGGAGGPFTLNILNYTSGAYFPTGHSGVDGIDDRLIFNQDQSGNLAFFSFNGTAAAEIDLGGGFWEVTPIPEPSTWGGAALAVLAIGYTQRRRFTRLLKRA